MDLHTLFLLMAIVKRLDVQHIAMCAITIQFLTH